MPALDVEPRPANLTLVICPSTSVKALLGTGGFPTSFLLSHVCPPPQCKGSGDVGFHWLWAHPQLCPSHPDAKYLKTQGASITKVEAYWLSIVLIFIHKHIILDDPLLFLSVLSLQRLQTREQPLSKCHVPCTQPGYFLFYL